MLTKIALDPGALSEHHEAPGLMRSIHHTVLETLNAHGRIIFRSDKEAKKFIDAIRSSALAPGLAKRWEETLRHLRSNRRAGVLMPQDDLSISSLSELADIEAGWAGKVSVMVLCSDTAIAIGVPPDEGVLDDPRVDLELATLHSTALTKTVRHLRELAASNIFPFGNRNSFWNEVLEPVAEISQSAVILDKYVFKELWYRAEQPRRFANSAPEHVAWLLQHLDASMRAGSTVHIIGLSVPPDPGLDETAEMLRKAWRPRPEGKLAKVQISLAHTRQGFPHDRHLRFSTNIGIALSAGFDRLSKPEWWDRNGLSWSYIYMPTDLERLRARENEALALQPATITMLQR